MCMGACLELPQVQNRMFYIRIVLFFCFCFYCNKLNGPMNDSNIILVYLCSTYVLVRVGISGI